ncbi:arginase family protein [bacterium]|nr:arginase family protein [bacterium]
MPGFLGADNSPRQNIDLQQSLLITGDSVEADLIRQASAEICPYSVMLRRDFRSFKAFDLPERADAALVLGYIKEAPPLPVVCISGQIYAPGVNMSVEEAGNSGTLPVDGTVWYVGARSFTEETERWARYNHRLLTAFELNLEDALKTSLAELNGNACRLILNVDILDPVWTPSLSRRFGFGFSPLELLRAFKCLEGANIDSVQVCGVTRCADVIAERETARIAAELARELSLTVFRSRLGK